jgi:succinate dehydrogenase / fumarate reductase flavoprotein subunit
MRWRCAPAPLIDMEFVQFFPIGHLAPRLVGMDPIMWDPFRYKLGGRLLNGRMEGVHRALRLRRGRQIRATTRDLATYAITKEVEAGRGSPHGGAYLSFEHCTAAILRAAFGPVIDRLARTASISPKCRSRSRRSRITTWAASRPTRRMATECPASFAPAKRSAAPTAPTGCPATRSPKRWCSAAAPAKRRRARRAAGHAARAGHQSRARSGAQRKRPTRPANTAAMIARLQAIMADGVGPLRTEREAQPRLADIAALAASSASGRRPARGRRRRSISRLDWFDLRNMLTVAREAVAQCALLARRKPRRAPARGFSANAAAMAGPSARRGCDGALQFPARRPCKALAS